MPKKKKTPEPVKVEEVKEPKNVLVKDLETLQMALKLHKINPMERVMATNLLLNRDEYYCQHKIELEDGDVCNGRKYFIVDFYLPRWRIVIETDGKIHNSPENVIKDKDKDNFLTGLGYRVFRFVWDEVMGNNENYNVLGHINRLEGNIEGEEERIYQEKLDEELEIEEWEKEHNKPRRPNEVV